MIGTLSQEMRLSVGMLSAALVLGILGDGLLRATPWGINVPIWIVLLMAATFGLAAWRGIALTGGGRWLVAPALFFASVFAWRASPALWFFNILALAATLALGITRLRSGRLVIAGIGDYMVAGIMAALHAVGGVLALALIDVKWNDLPRGRWFALGVSVGCGLLIALPLLLVFGVLFAAADPVFEKIVSDLLNWDVSTILSHLLLTSFIAWTVAGALRRTLIGNDSALPSLDRPSFLGLGIVESGVALALLDLLFALFVFVQLRYFFGGAELVQATTTLTYAEYARRGFFELVTVATLVLPMLLLAHWLLRRDRSRDENVFRVLAGALVLLLFVIMASAVQRMLLYVEAYGLTELRLYTTAFMGWLTIVFLWFLATVLRGRREQFAFGALVTGFAVVTILNFLNPDAVIVAVNANRPDAPRRFDTGYVTGLSADAVPSLVAALPTLSPEKHEAVVADLRYRWTPPSSVDWRTWNWSRTRAWHAVADSGAVPGAAAPSRRSTPADAGAPTQRSTPRSSNEPSR